MNENITKYKCMRLDTNFDIAKNGAADFFKNATEVFFRENVLGGAPKQKTSLKMVCTNENLYAMFDAEDSEIVAKYSNFNENLYEDDVCELFISPLSLRNCYDELEFNSLNAVFHGQIINNLKGVFKLYYKSESKIQTYTYSKNGGYITIAKIPFFEFVSPDGHAPKANDVWLFNAYRVDKNAKEEVELYALNPTLCPTFHTPKCFIELEF